MLLDTVYMQQLNSLFSSILISLDATYGKVCLQAAVINPVISSGLKSLTAIARIDEFPMLALSTTSLVIVNKATTPSETISF